MIGAPQDSEQQEGDAVPTPATAKWPKPKSEDEFEDIVAEFLKIRWDDRNAHRHGRRGQGQHGVDIIGKPQWLGGRSAGAQCKNTDKLTVELIMREVEEAKHFPGGLGEFYIVTSSDRDSGLEAKARQRIASANVPFPVHIIFWPDIVIELAGRQDLVDKFWKGFASTGTAEFAPAQEPRWLDRTSVEDHETTEVQVEFAITVGEPDLSAGEMARHLVHGLKKFGRGVWPRLATGQAVRRSGGRFTWAAPLRQASNHVLKFQIDVADDARVFFRVADFSDLRLRILSTSVLADLVPHNLNAVYEAIAEVQRERRAHEERDLGLRLSARGDGPIQLQDDAGITNLGYFSAYSEAGWTVSLQGVLHSQLPRLAMRLLNRALERYSGRADAVDRQFQMRPPDFIAVDEGAFKRAFDGP
jgi:hypothetical protein